MKMTSKERAEEVRKRVYELHKLDPFVVCTLQGMDFKLEFDNTAIKAVLQDMNINLLKDGLDRTIFEDPEKMAQFFFIAVQKHHNKKELDDRHATDRIHEVAQLDKYLGLKHYPYIIRCLNDSVTGFFPDTSDLPKIDENGEIVSDPS